MKTCITYVKFTKLALSICMCYHVHFGHHWFRGRHRWFTKQIHSYEWMTALRLVRYRCLHQIKRLYVMSTMPLDFNCQTTAKQPSITVKHGSILKTLSLFNQNIEICQNVCSKTLFVKVNMFNTTNSLVHFFDDKSNYALIIEIKCLSGEFQLLFWIKLVFIVTN